MYNGDNASIHMQDVHRWALCFLISALQDMKFNALHWIPGGRGKKAIFHAPKDNDSGRVTYRVWGTLMDASLFFSHQARGQSVIKKEEKT